MIGSIKIIDTVSIKVLSWYKTLLILSSWA